MITGEKTDRGRSAGSLVNVKCDYYHMVGEIADMKPPVLEQKLKQVQKGSVLADF